MGIGHHEKWMSTVAHLLSTQQRKTIKKYWISKKVITNQQYHEKRMIIVVINIFNIIDKANKRMSDHQIN